MPSANEDEKLRMDALGPMVIIMTNKVEHRRDCHGYYRLESIRMQDCKVMRINSCPNQQGRRGMDKMTSVLLHDLRSAFVVKYGFVAPTGGSAVKGTLYLWSVECGRPSCLGLVWTELAASGPKDRRLARKYVSTSTL